MAVASWAHISAYWASVAAIAAVFWPKKLVAMRASNWVRLATITGGGTVMAKAWSKAAAAALACMAVCFVCWAVAVSHCTYGVAAAVIDADAGPCQCSVVRPERTES